jgi:site-specific DNA-methyltransferase (adenine-specific)
MRESCKELKVDRRVVGLVPAYAPQGQELEEYIHRLRNEKDFAKIYVHRITGKIIAGYDKYELCRKHNIPFEIIYINFSSRDELERWVVNNHLQQTNLSMWKRSSLAVKYFKTYFEKQAKNNQRLSKGRGQKGRKNESNHYERIDTSERLAQKAGVGRETITKVNYIYENKEYAPDDLFQKLDMEEISVTHARTIVWRNKKAANKDKKALTRLSYINDLSQGVENQVLCMDAVKGINQIPDGSLTLCFTSPPFVVGKKYCEVDDTTPWHKHMAFLKNVFKALKKKFRKGGRCIIEFQQIRTREKEDQSIEYNRPVHVYIIKMMEELGYLYRTTIIWDKGRIGDMPLAYGSHCSPSSPAIRDMHSNIMVFSVDDWKLPCSGDPSELSHHDYDENTKSIWRISPETHGYGSHPCPFPVELPQRAIETFSFKNDLVCDCFGGSASTAIAAIRSGRRFVHIDLSETFCAEAKKRIDEEMKKINGGKNKAA